MPTVVPQPVIALLDQEQTTRSQGSDHPSEGYSGVRQVHEHRPTMDQIIGVYLKVVMSDIEAAALHTRGHVGQETGINVGGDDRPSGTDSLGQPPCDRKTIRDVPSRIPVPRFPSGASLERGSTEICWVCSGSVG
jgi:hypothetical protein